MVVPNPKNEFRYFSISTSRRIFSLIFQSQPPFLSPVSLPKTIASPLSPLPVSVDSDRFRSKIVRNLPDSSVSSTGSSAVSAPRIDLVSPHHLGGFRPFSAWPGNGVSPSGALRVRNPSVERVRSKAFWKKAWEIVDLIKRGENDLESKLKQVNVSLRKDYVIQVLHLLSSEKVSALRFFNWIRDSRPGLCRNYDICSLVIDNCGRIYDYESMICTFNEFNRGGICLTQNAFRFLPELASNEVYLRESVSQVAEILNAVGGTCRTSGVRSLIEMFSSLSSLEMAKFVIRITETKTAYYNIMIRETCRECDLEGSKALVREMRRVGCEPNITSYNLVISNICKNGESALDFLKEMDCSPDEMTFEIIISSSCKVGHFDFALELLDRMILRGLEPRLTTHAAFVSNYFKLQRYEEAHKYVINASFKHRNTSNLVYSLLAGLYLNEGNLASALSIFSEMIGRGLRPSYRVYTRLLKGLQRSGRDDEARELEMRFSSLSPQTITKTG
ncbi:Tetratricopeptide-like helical domain containing protein [Parasponia andersonii]|uniref:Tetratricopeptide-like helical domain containing protein n=1 Tax=Parasponia andersonii TaxID=3476 RepID=A0A2P5D4Z6_PARAD|nr:Tetratricopeptide-like helical domain containing protein [Parasponia andersonii]